jgi:hypothetical protein
MSELSNYSGIWLTFELELKNIYQNTEDVYALF